MLHVISMSWVFNATYDLRLRALLEMSPSGPPAKRTSRGSRDIQPAFWKEAGEPNDVNQKLTTISQVAQHELISKNIFFKLLGMKH